ncbi:MAG: 2OG-Fe(II) oxygenase superfamily protein [Myxococcales bacterium]|nr:2OG-Fe(II) oxygenase superfamily protein [Myxococcales bacterium]
MVAVADRLVEESPYEASIRAALAVLDVEKLTREFVEQGEWIFIPQLLPMSLVDQMAAEVRSFSDAEIHRVRVPFVRKAGTVGQVAIARKAPLLSALHRSPSLLAFTSKLSSQTLTIKNARDAHAAALYVYRRRGDHIGFHYDDCGCEDAASYTGTFGVINDTKTSRVEFQMFKNDKTRPMLERSINTTPGSFVFFCGSKAFHRVTPLGANEDRVAYSFAYVREGKRLRGFRRFTENISDAILYFGPKAIFQKNYR